MARAMSSFPVPVSPSMRAVESVGATVRTRSSTSRSDPLAPTMPSKLSFVNADPTFVRKSLSKLSKAGLVVTKRGKGGASVLSRAPRQITLLDVYRASAAPPAFAIHSYSVDKRCPVSCHLEECISGGLCRAQHGFGRSLAQSK